MDIKIRIIDILGAYSDYKLSLSILSSDSLTLKSIQSITLVSPQNLTIRYSDIISSSLNYDLNNSISLVRIDERTVPYYTSQNVDDYSVTLLSNFTVERTIQSSYKFKVLDYCGDEHFTNIFNITIYPNQAPTIVSGIVNSIFYEGQLQGVIPIAKNLFSDPGDLFIVYPSLWVERGSRSLYISLDFNLNQINVTYPTRFTGVCTLGIIAKDSVENTNVIVFQITVEPCIFLPLIFYRFSIN